MRILTKEEARSLTKYIGIGNFSSVMLVRGEVITILDNKLPKLRTWCALHNVLITEKDCTTTNNSTLIKLHVGASTTLESVGFYGVNTN